MFTQDAFLWRWRHNESIWSMLFIKFLVEAQEVAEAPPHCEGLVAEHGQCGLEETAQLISCLCHWLYGP